MSLIDFDAFSETYAASFPDSRIWLPDEFQSLLAQDTIDVLGNAEAFLIYRHLGDEAEVITLAIHPKFRRQGRAAALLSALVDKTKQAGAKKIVLEVAEDNDAARALYDTFGFVTLHSRKGYFRHRNRPSVDALLMALAL